jgi:hypothetical protein
MKSKHFTAESVNACVRNPVWNSVEDFVWFSARSSIHIKTKTYAL